VLEAASELFLAHGYTAVAMQDVAERAGLTKGGLYGHYRSKGQLLVEVIRWQYLQFESSPGFAKAISESKTAVSLLWSREGLGVRLLTVDAAAAARHDPDVLAGMAALDRERAAAVDKRLEEVPPGAQAVEWLVLALAAGIGMREAWGVRTPEQGELEQTVARLIDALLG
jgi:AcrR family transcriptional regulator